MYLLEEHCKQEREKIAPKNNQQKKFAFDQYTTPVNSDNFKEDSDICEDYKEDFENSEVINNKKDDSNFWSYESNKTPKPKNAKAFKVNINNEIMLRIANGEIDLNELEQLLNEENGNPGVIKMSSKDAEDLIKEVDYSDQSTGYIGENEFTKSENSSDEE